jgi:ATP-dependent phosphoenolpyruvate carboxykinase
MVSDAGSKEDGDRFIATLALEAPTEVAMDRVVAKMQEVFPLLRGRVSSLGAQSGKLGSSVIRIDDTILTVIPFDVPAPPGSFNTAVATEKLWPEAATELARHKAIVVVSHMGTISDYAGAMNGALCLTPEAEPEIFQALRFGAVLENVVFDPETHQVDFHDTSITQNTRGAYPIEFIRNAKIPCVAGHPTDVIFLTCDAFGVLPPVSKLSPAQAMYHFISGYTAKVAGTEMGVTEPQATFSPCFGGPFLVWRPAKYAELLAAKMQKHKANAWLVNTGWSGGAYGTGSRMKLKLTRAIISAIHSGELSKAETARDTVFGFEVPTACPGVPSEILIPRNTWRDKSSYDATAQKLAKLFRDNFEKYADGASAEVRAAGPASKPSAK